MIEVKHYPGCITIEGHAGYDVRGRDIVCAAVSALVQTFSASADVLTQYEFETVRGERGQIQAIKYGHLSERAQVLLDALFIGLQMIADDFPENVRVV